MKTGSPYQVIYCDISELAQICAGLASDGICFEASFSHAENAWEIRILGY